MKHQTNTDIRQRINLYFDNALSVEDQQDLLHKVECDNKCSKLFTKEKNFRDYIKNKVFLSMYAKPYSWPKLISWKRTRFLCVPEFF